MERGAIRYPCRVAANGGSSTAARLPDGAVLRLFRFRPAHGEFDRTLRTEMLPDLRKLPGLIDVHVGRHGSSELGDRIVASIWQDRDSMVRAIGGSLSTSTFHPEHMSETTDQVLEVHELAFAFRFAPPSAATVLRLFRGASGPASSSRTSRNRGPERSPTRKPGEVRTRSTWRRSRRTGS